MMDAVSKVMTAMSRINLSKTPKIPMLQLQGPIDREMYIFNIFIF